MMEDKPIPLRQKLSALGLTIVLAVVLYLVRNRLGADFWPLDSSRVGPNIVASLITWAFVVIAGVLIWPPTRRRIHKFADTKLDSVHKKLDEHLEHTKHQTMLMEEIHHKIHTGKDHPRVIARTKAKEETPNL
jgi:hypothetical protein